MSYYIVASVFFLCAVIFSQLAFGIPYSSRAIPMVIFKNGL